MPRSSILGLLQVGEALPNEASLTAQEHHTTAPAFALSGIQQALRTVSACPELLLRQSAGVAHPGEGSAREGPGKGEQVPRRDENQVQAGREGANVDEHGTPGIAVIKVEHLQDAWCRDGGA
eukprot:1153647-Pelagomonas_calceolata.AAC.1